MKFIQQHKVFLNLSVYLRRYICHPFIDRPFGLFASSVAMSVIFGYFFRPFTLYIVEVLGGIDSEKGVTYNYRSNITLTCFQFSVFIVFSINEILVNIIRKKDYSGYRVNKLSAIIKHAFFAISTIRTIVSFFTSLFLIKNLIALPFGIAMMIIEYKTYQPEFRKINRDGNHLYQTSDYEIDNISIKTKKLIFFKDVIHFGGVGDLFTKLILLILSEISNIAAFLVVLFFMLVGAINAYRQYKTENKTEQLYLLNKILVLIELTIFTFMGWITAPGFGLALVDPRSTAHFSVPWPYFGVVCFVALNSGAVFANRYAPIGDSTRLAIKRDTRALELLEDIDPEKTGFPAGTGLTEVLAQADHLASPPTSLTEKSDSDLAQSDDDDFVEVSIIGNGQQKALTEAQHEEDSPTSYQPQRVESIVNRFGYLWSLAPKHQQDDCARPPGTTM